jgi:tricorn protease
MLTPLPRRPAPGLILALTLAVTGCAAMTPPDVLGPPLGGATALPGVMEEPQAATHLMRFADVHDDRIVFTYEDDLWLVSTNGGDARRITDDPGTEMWAKFSPDGQLIAFTGQYDGGTDVYVIDAHGGVPQRLTYHPAADRVLGWWPDGQRVLFRSTREYPFRAEEIYTIALEGGMPEKLPVDRAGLTAVSPDGKMIAYNRISREAATWKRYQGGMAQDIWLGSLEKGDFHKITDWVGTDNFPMWEGNAIYFTSDRQFGTLNLYKCDVNGGKVTPLTAYKDYDVKYPSIGPGKIVYQYGETLNLLDLANGSTRLVPTRIPSDRVPVRSELVKVAPTTGSFSLSPTGKRMLLEARGEILNLPVKDGEPINLTDASGSREKNAAWSPDGRWIAFLSDRTGEEEVYLVDQKREHDARQLTSGGLGFRMQLVWSPDSKFLLFADKFLRLNLVDAATGDLTVVDRADYDDTWERWGIQDYVWSPDSKWIAYTKMEQSVYESIFLYSLDSRESSRLTDGTAESWSPSFDPTGKYLYFLSNRTFNPIMCFVDQNHIFLDMARPYVVLLAKDAASPFAPKDSEEELKEPKEETAEESETQPATTQAQEPVAESQEAEKDKEKGEKKKEGKKPECHIDLDGLERRMVVAEKVPAGNYFRLEATEKGFAYLKKNEPEFEKYQNVSDQTGGSLDLYHYELEKKETTKVLGGIANYHQSADGKKLVYRAGSSYGVVDVGSKAEVGDGKVDLDGVRIKVERQAELLQIFNEAWRVERDWFYDAGMHGLDWPATGDKYRRFVADCGDRSDLNYLIGEMIAELNIGHTYVSGGDLPANAHSVTTGMLGAVFAADPGVRYYRIAHIIPGTPGDEKERSPLDEPGCPIKVGDYLIAIDGDEVTTADDVYAFLQNKADKVVTLTYNPQPSREEAKKYRVRTIAGEQAIRYRAWVAKKRAYVHQASGGRIGYVHIPDMGERGLIEFAKAYYPQYYKQGLVLDDRYNGGGFTSDMIIDRLERRLWGMTQPREGKMLRDPERCFHGHYAVLINEDTGSCGEFFAEAIKLKGLAPVIGVRTWGGAIGIEPHQPLVDGGSVTPPQFGLYGLKRTWLIEGRGVEPDLEVQNMPGDVLKGQDAQLETAVKLLLERIAKEPRTVPEPPPYPNKSK